MIFGLRRYSKIFRIHYQNEVILNIRIFHSQGATIKNSIENSFQNSSKISGNLSPERFRIRHPLRHSLRRAFWVNFGFILGPLWTHSGPEIVQNGFRRASESSLDFISVLESILEVYAGSCPVGPAAGAGPV